MDKRPFFTFDLQSCDEGQVGELARFQKEQFSIDTIIEAASNLKYTNAAASYLKKQLTEPDDEFTKLVGRQIHDGMLTKSVVEQLRPAIQAALEEVIRSRIQDKLNVAFRPEAAQPSVDVSVAKGADGTSPQEEVETTDDELQAFMIVRAIAARTIDLDRITMRDAKSYCAVFVDDNNRKPVCRFYFNSKTKRRLGLFDASKEERRIDIEKLSEIYDSADAIEAAVRAYL